jgi:hypothetical protein
MLHTTAINEMFISVSIVSIDIDMELCDWFSQMRFDRCDDSRFRLSSSEDEQRWQKLYFLIDKYFDVSLRPIRLAAPCSEASEGTQNAQ